MKKILIILLIFLSNNCKAHASKLNVYYSGFSFSNTYESNVEYSKYSSILIKEKIPDLNTDLISSSLSKSLKSSRFDNINLIFNELIDLNNIKKGSIVMSVTLQHEEFSQEYNNSSNVFNGFYDSYFQILFYDFATKNLIASIPFDFEIPMLSENEFTEEEIILRIKKFYLDNKPFNRIQNIINNFELKPKYNLRIGVTQVNIDDRAYNNMPLNSKKFKNATQNLIAQTFSKRFSYIHNVAMVPYSEGQAIGNAMKLRFVQSDEIYSINLPDPDYHVFIRLKGFKKVLAKSSASEDLYLYGSFFKIRISQPELNKIYFEEELRGVTDVKIPKDQTSINDWRKYFYNMEAFFDNFSKNIIKQDSKWLKKASKKKLKKKMKNLNQIIVKLK